MSFCAPACFGALATLSTAPNGRGGKPFFGYEQVHAGTYSPAVADGVFLMLAPLPVGKHTIVVRGENPTFRLAIRYDITITPGK